MTKKKAERTPRNEATRVEKILWDEQSSTYPINVVPVDAPAADDVLPCLVMLAGPQIGQVFPLRAGHVRIGRAEDCDVSIEDGSISRYHAAIACSDDRQCSVEDLKSTNGTFVNGGRIKKQSLKVGDRLQLGRSTILKLELHTKADEEYRSHLFDAGTRDPLTNIYNRRYFDQHLDADFRLAVRHHEELSLLMIDVDHFKEVNDTHGHLAGDQVLRVLAQILTERLRAEDILARYGGEEFAIILRRTAPAGARILAESMRALIERATFSYKRHRIRVSVSIGIATLGPESGHAEAKALLADADAALYRAKEAGRNRVETAG